VSADPPPGAPGPSAEPPSAEPPSAELPSVPPAGPPPHDETAPAPSTEPVAGPDLVRAALASARAAARAKGLVPGTPARRPPRRPPAVRSGAGPDGRDPMPFGAAIARVVADRGWQESTAAGRVLGDWSRLVGPEIADHCRPASLVDGELVLVAESSAWATQLRLLTRTLQARLTAQVGEGVVTSVVVRGPTTPDWRRGPRRVRGRGPRDTYG
jgi:predicted nucleic acid-binding Zn ribbon protein